MLRLVRKLSWTVLPLLLGSAAAAALTVPIDDPAAFAPSAALIDFETGDGQLPSIDGVTFVREGTQNDADWFGGLSTVGAAMFGAQFYGNQSNLELDRFSSLAIAFEQPQPAVGAWISQMPELPNAPDTTPEFLTVTVLDAEDAVLASRVVELPPLASPSFFGFASEVGIARIEWRPGPAGFFGVDDVRYGAIVPEPNTALLVANGLALLAHARRRAPRRSSGARRDATAGAGAR
jgi:hypothetical protein